MAIIVVIVIGRKWCRKVSVIIRCDCFDVVAVVCHGARVSGMKRALAF